MAELAIPVYDALSSVYPDSYPNQATRWNALAEEFTARFGRKPTHICRAPGRVNLIGEHIDYALFGVLPAAIEPDFLVACAVSESGKGQINLQNLNAKYKPQHFAAQRDQNGKWHLDIDTTELRWDSYVKAGYYGVLENFFTHNDAEPVSIDMLCTGTVPGGSGLSSSAAVIVASTLAFATMNGHHAGFTRGRLVELSMENERRVGVNSGGMDQAASAIPPANSALYITFYPKLHAEPIALPEHAVLVIAHSLFVSEKALTAKTNYNLRVVETLVAARVLARRLGVEVGKTEKITLREVLQRWTAPNTTELSPEALRDALERILPHVAGLKLDDDASLDNDDDTGHTLDEMVEVSGLSASEFHDVYLSWVDVEATHFQLYKRAKHVFTEALRVLQVRDLCLAAADGQIPSDEKLLQSIGDLFNASQTSCDQLFNCSAEGLNTLTTIARKAGAYGSRLTGAGWGGCTVSLVPADQVEHFIKTLAEEYAPYRELTPEALADAVFATKPGSGACVYTVSQ
ncbi:Galactokinase [Exidia glandulosa HHB12029]|uniref:Galactokinase n=1 Tax=Exidia glandulosa HHB12029 TaxID=1314781 RepID=A0A165JE38_EXIGL|nr:Galactokinase [Exidia glandulosa HHB12029]